MQKCSDKNTGFTIIEILIAVSIAVILSVVVNRFIVQGYKSITFTTEQEEAVEQARNALDIMITEIRSANSSEQGAYTLLTIENQNFVYYSDIDSDGETERVRYFLEESELKKVVVEAGESRDYSGAGTTSTIASYVNNQESSIFVYYDADYLEVDAINDIRLVNIQLKINVTPQIAPNDYWARTDVNLRNLKDNL
jgi:prepilin-type N-terminal cleavage/methylation domain-containing protein